MNIKEQMDLLQMKEITTERQKKNGTRIFQLPIKMYGKYIKVGSFKSGYVRRLECIGYRSDSSYQLNKRCESEPQYYEILEWDSKADMNCKRTGKYRKFTTRTCKLIPNEVDRLEYLISYCLKNYYIKQANMIEDSKFVPAWKYQDLMDRYEEMSLRFEETAMELSDISVIINGHRYKVK